MAVAKSPFIVLRNFVSPKICEQYCDTIAFIASDIGLDGKPIKMIKHNAKFEEIVFDKLQPLIPVLESYYNIKYKGTEEVFVEWLDEGVVGNPTCENSEYMGKKWVRTMSRDLSGVLFMSDHSNTPDFDSDYEVYGGKLEFYNHKFGFNPERGTLIIYPSGPHFVNANTQILAGELYQARIQIAAMAPFLYDPSLFPGDYRTWFDGL